MSDLGANDLVLILNKRVIRHLAISLDHMFRAGVNGAVGMMEFAAAFDSTLSTWLNRGLEHQVEIAANLLLTVPRTLYATTNPAFSPIPPGATDRETLINRLERYDVVAPGPIVGTIPANAQIGGVPLNNPCSIPFKEDPNRRFTFLRGGFFPNNATSFLEVTPNGLQITITGTAYRGNLFSRHRAKNYPTHTFTMTLLYKVRFVNDSDINLGPVPFRMVASPPPAGPGRPSLPANGSFVFASRIDAGRFVLPTLVPNPDNPSQLVQPGNLPSEMFNGELDDEIYESLEPAPFWPVPRYRVEPRSDEEPERFVIREIGDPAKTVLAEAQAGRLLLAFDSMVSIELDPNDVNPTDKALIGNSLCKIQPTLSQAFRCAEGLDAAPVNMNALSLLGAESLDIPIAPRSFVVPTEAQIVTSGNMLPGPANSVFSTVLTCDVTAEKYFPNPNPHQQCLAVSGKIGGTGDQIFNDFSSGSDLSTGVSQTFLQPMLDRAAEDAKKKILDDGPPGLDGSTLQVNGSLDTGAFVVAAAGNGEIETPFFLPNIGYGFTATINARLRTHHLVLLEDGQAVDRFHCPIVANIVVAGQAICQVAYWDPHNGIACFADCPQPVRIPPPVLDANGNEILIDDPDNPPNICEDLSTEEQEQRPDDPLCFGAASFTLSQNAGLKRVFGLEPAPPKDDDIELGISINWGALFLAGFNSILFAAAFGAPLTALAILPLSPLILTAPLVNLIAGAIAFGEIKDRIAEQDLQMRNLDLTVGAVLGLHLEDPDVRPPFTLQPGAFILRHHLTVEAEGLNTST
jgi:hypothetical protein